MSSLVRVARPCWQSIPKNRFSIHHTWNLNRFAAPRRASLSRTLHSQLNLTKRTLSTTRHLSPVLRSSSYRKLLLLGGAFALAGSVSWATCEESQDKYEDYDEEDDETVTNKALAVASTALGPLIAVYEYVLSLFVVDDKDFLPPPSPDEYGRVPRTLILNLDKTLVHAVWTRDDGWRIRTRPYVNLFLKKMALANYEIVVWADGNKWDYEDTILMLDPEQTVKHRLFRDCQRFKNGKYVHDLTRINRDLRKVIIIDHNRDNFSLQPENGIRIKPFKKNLRDKELLKLIPLLTGINKYNVVDVRKVLEKYNEDPGCNPFEAELKVAEEFGKKGTRSKKAVSRALGGLFSRKKAKDVTKD